MAFMSIFEENIANCIGAGMGDSLLYRFRTDLLLKHNLLEELPQECGALERELKAVIQSYMERMVHDRLTAE